MGGRSDAMAVMAQQLGFFAPAGAFSTWLVLQPLPLRQSSKWVHPHDSACIHSRAYHRSPCHTHTHTHKAYLALSRSAFVGLGYPALSRSSVTAHAPSP